ncbi:hypothetical protein AU210_004758 [Fusarium oxysporum f. sp. radicis-cucumerinum]|uniref:Uncharacterized protein n=1 Tax=Fusarium oxysporum f. sp. radicis-cucumerinum TaxID=327505 RepID=A0A2H3HNR7_FUSOX|nr:hypothetical protein AU210_004758 [Fusarium oxysporum f. sp. radicis-cucumerinum]WKT41405.1 hypothetical protein QSH57_006211 [Fusarium oxysporum f. sp. vasinfectum]
MGSKKRSSASGETGNATDASSSRSGQPSRSLRRRAGDIVNSLNPTGAGKGPDVMQQLAEIPFNAEAFLQAKAAQAKALDAEANLENVGIEPPEETESWVEQSEPSKFAGHVYRFLGRQCRSASSDRHLYVLYHPDAEWHADFYDLLQDKPLPSNFLGFSDNLDALVAFVRFIRKRLGKRANNAMFHLLIPSSRPMSIRDALEFPDLGDLVIHGETHGGNNYVWVNLPTSDDYPANLLLKHVENAVRGESEWKTTATVSTAIGGLTASLAGAAFTLRVKGAPFPSLKTFGIGAVCTTIAARIRGAEYLPLAVLGIGGLCTTIAALQVNRGLSKRVPRLIGGTDTPKEPKAEPEKEDSAASEQDESKDEAPQESDVLPEPEPPAVPEEPSKIKDDSDALSFLDF